VLKGVEVPEVSEDATLLLAASWQARGRVLQADPATLLCDCTILLVFAGFYVESNLNHIISALDTRGELEQLVQPKKPGLQQKLAWYYLEFNAKTKVTSKRQLNDKALLSLLRKEFPGFDEIYDFRNDVAHGRINRSIANPDNALELRDKAKSIAKRLFDIAREAGYDIPRLITYNMAISSEPESTS
jgi:hypothetical protein